MKRREFISLIGGATVAWPLGALGQQPGKLPLIGVLVSASPPHPFADAFWRGLHALGYSEGQNIKVEFRYTDGRSDRAEEYAEELVQLRVDVIVAHYAVAVSAAMAATRMIPIVMAPHGAPLQLGVIDSLARPGGNVTGLSIMDAEIGGKRLQLLRETHSEPQPHCSSRYDPDHEPIRPTLRRGPAFGRQGRRCASDLNQYWSVAPASSEAPSRQWIRRGRKR